jgi:hypothetical protein
MRYAALLIVLALTSLAHADLVLVDNGVALPIITPADAPPRTKQVADELAVYVEKTSGVKPQVIVGAPAQLPEHAMWVGVQPAVQSAMPKTNLEFTKPEETLIACDGNHLLIAGRDRWDPQHTQRKGRLAMKTDIQQEYGTLNAVYSFIQDDLKVRWLWPGEIGEDVLPQKRIAFAPFERRYAPQLRARADVFHKLSLGDTKEGPQQDWARRQRVQLDSLEIAGGHAFNTWWNKYHAQHPDYFALLPDGTRNLTGEPSRVKLCLSNPAVWQQWLAEVDEQLKINPNQSVFNCSENDSYTTGYCVCPNCRAWDNPAAEKWTYSYGNNTTLEMTAMSDRQVTFANHLAKLLKAKYPGRDYYVQMHAYGSSRAAPIAAKPEPNVIISSVTNFHLRHPSTGGMERSIDMQQFDQWSKLAKHLSWRPNLGSPVGLSWGMPDVDMTQAGEDFRFIADRGCLGLFFDLFWFHWSTQGPHYYTLAHLAWDPHADVTAVMDDYYQRGFGPAAADIKAYWTLLEQTRQKFVDDVPNKYRAFAVHERYTPELLAKAQAHLDDAQTKAANGPEVYRKRIDYVRFGLEYTRLVVDTRASMEKFEKSKGADKAAAEHVKANWETLGKMSKTAPPFAINFSATFSQPDNKRMLGLHPDFPLSGRVLREFLRPGLE